MARKDVSFVDLHIEKVVLGVCAAGVLGAIYLAFAAGRFDVNERSPSQLVVAASDAADQARQAVQSARYNPPQKETATDAKNDPIAQLAEWYGQGAKGLIGIAELKVELPRAQRINPQFVSIMKTAAEDRRDLAKIVAPTIPILSSGRSTFRFLREKPDLASFDPRLVEDQTMGKLATTNWVSVGAQVDLIEQQAGFLAQRYPEGSSLQIVKIHLQRRDVNEPSVGWEDVNTYLPFNPPKRPTSQLSPDGRIRVEGLESLRSLVDEQRVAIVNTPLGIYHASGDKVELPTVPYLDEPPEVEKIGGGSAPNLGRVAKKWTDWANAALKGRKPYREVDLHAALILARAAVALSGVPEKETAAARAILERLPEKLSRDLKAFAKSPPRDPRRLMPILAHDLTALPGHTYIYRMRYEVINVFAGNTAELKVPRDALRVTLFSEWSLETRPIEIKSDTYFYLTKADKAKKEVTVSIFKVTRSGATRQDVKVSPGEEIGKKEKRPGRPDFSTGTVCVDIDFDRVIDGKKEIALVYANASDGVVSERTLSRDQKDPIFKKIADMVKTARP